MYGTKIRRRAHCISQEAIERTSTLEKVRFTKCSSNVRIFDTTRFDCNFPSFGTRFERDGGILLLK